MRRKRVGTIAGRIAGIGAVGAQIPALRLILEIGDHDLVQHLLMHGRIVDRNQGLDAAVEVARHPVRRGDVDLGLRRRQSMTRAEADDAAMLEEAADDALYPDVLGQAGHARPQAADAAHDELDLHARLAGAVERVDHARIDQRVELGPDRGGPPGLACAISPSMRFDQLPRISVSGETAIFSSAWARHSR